MYVLGLTNVERDKDKFYGMTNFDLDDSFLMTYYKVKEHLILYAKYYGV